MDSPRLRRWAWSLWASHSDDRLVRAARHAAHRLVELLHAENHDFRTNGEARLLAALGRTAATVLDVGANRGGWALEARRHCPGATIYCFEIAPRTRQHLRERVAGVRGIEVQDFGLLDRPGWERVKYYPGRDGVTSIYDYPHPEPYVWERAPVRRGDSFLEAAGLSHVDLLKVDAEGADLRVLLGFEGAISRGEISVIQFEYGYACVLARALLIDFYEYLEPKNYVIGKLHRQGVEFRPYRLRDENFFGPNFVAVHRSQDVLIRRLGRG